MSDPSLSSNGHPPPAEGGHSGVSAKAVISTLLLVGGIAAVVGLSGPMATWVLSLVLIFACGVYVSFEFALVQIPLRELEREVEQGVPGSRQLLNMKREINAMLAACQFGITLTSLGLTLALEPAIAQVLHDYVAEAPPGDMVAQVLGSGGVSRGLAMGLGAFMHVTFGELIPKGLALVEPKKVLHASATYMAMFRWVSIPFIKTCNGIANVVVRWLTGKNPDTDSHHGENVEIGEAVVMAHAQGRIEDGELQLIKNVLNFSDRTAREVMTPARKVVSLDTTLSWDENMAIAEEHGFSRFPVIAGNPHDVIGYIRRDQLLQSVIDGKKDLMSILLPIQSRPETAPLPALNLFRGSPLVAIYDEHDSFSGLLTAEDVIEQVMGEIFDETDDLEAAHVDFRPDGSIRMDGELLLEVAAETLGLREVESHGDVDTIGGLVLKTLARQPEPGDRVRVEGWDATVQDAQGFRIVSLIFERVVVSEEPAEGDDQGNDEA